MHIFFTAHFKKRFEKLSKKDQVQFQKRLDLFLRTPQDPVLKNHPLKGYLIGLRAFSVRGDCRVIYRIVAREAVRLLDIGTHNQVY